MYKDCNAEELGPLFASHEGNEGVGELLVRSEGLRPKG